VIEARLLTNVTNVNLNYVNVNLKYLVVCRHFSSSVGRLDLVGTQQIENAT